MARITVEDCLENVDNRFELVLIASKRARQIAMGSTPKVSPDNDKPTVIALREIAENLVDNNIDTNELALKAALNKINNNAGINKEIIEETQSTDIDEEFGDEEFSDEELIDEGDLPIDVIDPEDDSI